MFQFVFLNFILLSLTLSAKAHVPRFPQTNPSLENPLKLQAPLDKSIAVYTQMDDSDDLDVYEFSLEQSDLTRSKFDILIGTLVPACSPLKDLRLSWALVGPKQPVLDSLISESLPITNHIQDKESVLYIKNEIQGDIWYERYTAHYYFRQIRKKISLTLPGTYKIFVWSHNQKAGDYVLEFGDQEMWPISDILYTLWVYPKLLLEGEIKTPGCRTSDLKD